MVYSWRAGHLTSRSYQVAVCQEEQARSRPRCTSCCSGIACHSLGEVDCEAVGIKESDKENINGKEDHWRWGRRGVVRGLRVRTQRYCLCVVWHSSLSCSKPAASYSYAYIKSIICNIGVYYSLGWTLSHGGVLSCDIILHIINIWVARKAPLLLLR